VKIAELLRELSLEIDDIRWYLALAQADRLLQYKERRKELARLIWSGRLEAELYEMEERFLQELQGKLDRGTRDEAQVRTLLLEAAAARREGREG
jgi:hypothetical protein